MYICNIDQMIQIQKLMKIYRNISMMSMKMIVSGTKYCLTRRYMSSTTTAATTTNIRQWWHDSTTTTTKNHQWWDRVTPATEDPIMDVSQAFLSDTSPLKINLGMV